MRRALVLLVLFGAFCYQLTVLPIVPSEKDTTTATLESRAVDLMVAVGSNGFCALGWYAAPLANPDKLSNSSL